MSSSKSNWLVELCMNIKNMLDNDNFNYTSSHNYNGLISKVISDVMIEDNSYNSEEYESGSIFSNYTDEKSLVLNILEIMFKSSGKYSELNPFEPQDKIYIENYLNKISTELDKSKRNMLPVIQNSSQYMPNSSIVVSNHGDSYQKKMIKVNEKKIDNFGIILQQNQQIAIGEGNLHQNIVNAKNRIIGIHKQTMALLTSRGLNVWKISTNKLSYIQNAFAKEQKVSKNELNDITTDALGFNIDIYDSTDDVMIIEANYLIIALLPTVRKDIFNPWSNFEFPLIANSLCDRNKFEYTELLQKRVVPSYINQLEQEISNLRMKLPYSEQFYQQISNQITDKEYELQQLRDSLVVSEESFIANLLKHIFQNNEEFSFFMVWLSNFFWTLNKSNMAVVLIGDKETTDTLVNSIIKPIFARNKKYISTIDDKSLKDSDDDELLTDKIFYRVDNLNSKTDIRRVSKLLRTIVRPNSIQPTQAWDNDEQYIYGELLVTSEKESPYSYLKNIFGSCTVLKIRSMDTILNKLYMEYSEFDKRIDDDLPNFVNMLVQYGQNNNSLAVLHTDEKSYLHTMKNGLLVTPALDIKINKFLEDVRGKKLEQFEAIRLYDEEMYQELSDNFDENMIAQSMHSTYFNVINGEEIISHNGEFLNVLKLKAKMYMETPNDKSKANGKKRYQIF